MKRIDRQILDIAIPSILSNITVPLLGLVDVTIVGHLGAPAYIGAIAVGGLLFNMIYWIFAFLRMGTSGLTAQAYGKRDLQEVTRLLLRSVGIGLAVALLLILLQTPIKETAFLIIQPTADVEQLASIYYRICIWGAPATLGLYGLTGWYIGMQNSRFPLIIAIIQNVVNIGVSLMLVYGLGMKVEGVALGTVIAQYAGFLTAVGLWLCSYGKLRRHIKREGLLEQHAMSRFFKVNRDIFLRTLCLVAVTLYFTSAGASQGEIILAVNTLLMQFFTIYSYIMDGFAFAGESLSGRYIGAQNAEAFHDTTRRLFRWGLFMAILFTGIYAFGGNAFLGLLTSETSVIAAADSYFYWAMLIPCAGMAAFIWDGIYIGATATRQMLLSMAIAASVFFIIYYTGHSRWGNHALWVAFLSYLATRGIVQTLCYKKIKGVSSAF